MTPRSSPAPYRWGVVSARITVAAVSTALAAGLIIAAPVSAVPAFTVSGTAVFHPPPHPEQLVPGFFTGDVVTNIAYPAAIFGMDASVAVAAAGIERAVAQTPGPLVISGFSQGAIAVTYAMRAVMALPTGQRPAADQLTFLTIGDPTAPSGILRFIDVVIPVIGLTPVAMPDTPYDTVIVNGEYDGWGDFPDRPWNLISVANALLGTIYVHGRYETIPGGLDLSTVSASTRVNSLGGTTTTYLIPTPKLPLLQPLRDIGVPEDLVASLDAPLRAIVDAGYVRNDPPPGGPAAAEPVSAPPRTAALPAEAAQARRGAAAPARPAVKDASRQRGSRAAS